VYAIATLLLIPVVWALVSRRLERVSVTMAIVATLLGVLLLGGKHPAIDIRLDTSVVQRGIGLVLAILLFLDANEVRGHVIGRERSVLMRLFTFALPLSLIIAWAIGALLFPGRSVWLLAVLAAIVVPLDLAPAGPITRDHRIPRRLRDILTVEAGLSDGLITPVFLFALVGASASHAPVLKAVENAVPAMLIALGVGGAVGLVGALSLSWSWDHDWSDPTALRLGVAALPVMTYVLALALGGNGFVAAFVAGAPFAVDRRGLPGECLQLAEDTGLLLSLCVWFLFGSAVREVIDSGPDLDALAYALAALTVVRIVPVMLALRRTDIDRHDALFLGWMGPRGLASMLFGLLALSELDIAAGNLVAQVMVLTVLLSVVLHGVSARPIAAAFVRPGRPVGPIDEPAAAPAGP
jgi:sodium/hydrogen antiporter